MGHENGKIACNFERFSKQAFPEYVFNLSCHRENLYRRP